MNRFDCVLSAILHEEPHVTPQSIGFTNEMARAKFVPFLQTTMPPKGVELESEVSRAVCEITAAGLKKIDDALKIAEFMDNFIIWVGGGGFRIKRTIETGSEWNIIEWETGAKWRVGTSKIVWARQYIDYPVKNEDDLESLELPDPDDPSRYEGIEKAIKYVVERGFFPSCDINGFFSGVWYFLRGPLEVSLRDMYQRREFFKKLIAKMGEFNLKAEKNLLERGAMMIGWPDDLGYRQGPFMNPKLYEEIIYPWHVKAIELAHKYGAFVNMHSHGKIDSLVPLFVKAGLDVLNPIGPTDNMNLQALKDDYGDRLCLLGGLSKNIGLMGADELREHLLDRLRIGSPGGGFILGSEGDIPVEMSLENFELFINLSKKYRRNRPNP
ncbi:MAG: uroporphyrinogen decarboxylase family protein [Nitrososphaerota archaeon]|nr:uroporphyrinogen decarboxylase family protein [Candidatus Bathyarchaeota archaeon]MDW8048990.1 uroporphyrinogen decarboxylase family protein [Nitrososphaerota archaeon]